MTGGYCRPLQQRSVTIGLKFFELAVMLVAAAGLATMNLYLVLAAIFLASTQAAAFSDRQIRITSGNSSSEKLSWVTRIELGTFLALICGSRCRCVPLKIYAGRMVARVAF